MFIEGERVGPLMLYGRGAGGDPTATSVVGDLIELARGRGAGGSVTVGRTTGSHGADGPPRSPAAPIGRAGRPVLPAPARWPTAPGCWRRSPRAFAHHEVSIKSVRQEGHGDEAQLVLVTHEAVERDLAACVRDLRRAGAWSRCGR